MVWFVLVGLVCFVIVILGVLFDRTRFGLVWFGLIWFGLFVVVILGVLFDRTRFGLVCFVLLYWVSILVYYNEFDEDKAGYWFRDWFAMSRNMTSLLRL